MPTVSFTVLEWVIRSPEAVFSPLDVFTVLYRERFNHISQGKVIPFENQDQVLLTAGFVKLVQESFEQLFRNWVQDTRLTAVELHRHTMCRLWDHHRTLHSTRTCLSCQRRAPSICLPGCMHLVCENCVELFAHRDSETHFRIRCCFFCGMEMPEDVVVKIHPPTKGVGVVCVDGGGTRGVIPIRAMQRIEASIRDLIGAHLPFQTLFRMGFGVSIGKFLSLLTQPLN